MSLAQNIKRKRQELRLSQGYIADQLGVSRQAVFKWESGQSEPSADHLVQLAELLETTLTELTEQREASEGESKEILRANLTNIAIAVQAGMLHGCTNVWVTTRGTPDPLRLFFNLAGLLLCSLWMVRNLFYEKDPVQRRKNSRIEVCYCLVQLGIALITVRFSLGMVGFGIHAAVVFFYLYVINPRYMNRAFTKKGMAALREE